MTEIHTTIQKGWQIAKVLNGHIPDMKYMKISPAQSTSRKANHWIYKLHLTSNMFDITANVTACLQYNHQYNSAENRSNSLDNLSLVFVIMRSGRTSL